MTDEQYTQLITRLVKLEVEVINHIPSQIKDIKDRVRGVDARVWALVFGVAIAAVGAWMR